MEDKRSFVGMKDMRIDLGCGTHRVEATLGVDLHALYPDIRADIRERIAALDDGCASDVFCNHVLEHLPGEDWYKVMVEVARLLKRGGKFVIKVPHPSNENSMIHGHICVLTPYWWRAMQRDNWLGDMLIIDQISEVYTEGYMEDATRYSALRDIPSKYLMNAYEETVIEGHKP